MRVPWLGIIRNYKNFSKKCRPYVDDDGSSVTFKIVRTLPAGQHADVLKD